jgi:hypothetical protein
MHHPSSGQPYTSDSDGLGEFAPKGEPENLNAQTGKKPDADAEVNAALAEFAPLTGAKKYSSLAADAQKIAIPSEGTKSIENRKT